jgi:hypothetical protein
MAAKDALNPILFHGTGGAIEGDVVDPDYSYDGSGAFATPNKRIADNVARMRAAREGRLFGTTYEVQLMSEGLSPDEYEGGLVEYKDPKGLRVVRAVDYPINTAAIYKPPSE